MEQAFEQYIKPFLPYDKDQYRKDHSYRVQSLCKQFSTQLSEEDQQIMSEIGLLHDIGFFPQFLENTIYDHADYGVSILFDNHVINQFPIAIEHYPYIKVAIQTHNKLELPIMDNKTKTFCTILRDADRLDILEHGVIREFPEKECQEPFTQEVIDDFSHQRLVNRSHVKNGNDFILVALAFIFDLQLDSSFQYIKEHQMIEKLYNILQQKQKFQPYFSQIQAFIERKNQHVR